MNCGSKVAKILLIIFNLIFFLVGCALLAVGIWVLVSPDGIRIFDIMTRGFDDPLLRNAAIVLTVGGALIIIISFFGWIGACCENTCMLLTFAVLVGLMLLVQLVAGILAAVYVDKIEGWLKDEMDQSIAVYKNKNARSTAIDTMQVWFECCGQNGPSDWNGHSIRNATWRNDVPPSCCKLKEKDPLKIYQSNFQDPNCGTNPAAGSSHTRGCYESMKKWLKDHAIIIAGVAFGLVIIEIFVIVLACCLRSAILREKEGTV